MSTTASHLITLNDLCKNYYRGGVRSPVLKKISLSIAAGELAAIVGASGSGKSTLMNILGLLDKACEGQYWLNGQEVSRFNDDEQARYRNQQIGFVFQQFHLLPRFTVQQNVALPLLYRGLSKPQIAAAVDCVLDQVGMANYVHYRPLELSGGQQQRIAIARALVGDPTIILADEPTGALDSHTSAEIMQLFHTLHAEGRTVLLITHDKQIAEQCPRTITIADGEIIAENNS